MFLTNAYPDFPSSYRGSFIKGMATQLQKSGYQISVVTPKIYDGSHYFEEKDGIKVYRFPFFAGNKLLIEYQKIPYLRMILYCVSGFFVSVYTLLKQKCHLIHVHWVIPTGLIGLVAGTLLRKAFIVTLHGSDLRMAMTKPFLLGIFLRVCKRAKHITCVSEVQRNQLKQLGIKSEKISIFPMCVEDAFLEVGRRREKDPDRKTISVVSNRNLMPIYNVLTLIRAIPWVLKEEPDTKFIIAGDGPERERLEKEAEKLNINSKVQFLGRLPHEAMPDLLSKADIYVSTSLCDGTSVSLLEAMACGTFPVVTDIPSNRQWVSDGKNGFLVPVNEDGTLARRILDAIRNQALLRKGQKENLLLIAEKAIWPEHIRKVEEIYSRFANSRA
ncbi:MAG: glycosyltransferase [Syntrophaceae bacterium]|nr:glycosyltransferase [Syntrophaceae bacterium]